MLETSYKTDNPEILSGLSASKKYSLCLLDFYACTPSVLSKSSSFETGIPLGPT